jgi:SAM-dependent methyltransferase
MTIPDRTFPPSSFHRPVRRLFRRPAEVLDFWGPGPGETAVDYGAGGGYFLPELLRRIGPGGRVYAVDIDAAALAVARSVTDRLPTPRPPVEFLHRSAASVPAIPATSVDYALSNGLLCCMVAKAESMEELWRVLRPGGRALVTFRTLVLDPGARGRALRRTGEGFDALVGERRGASSAAGRDGPGAPTLSASPTAPRRRGPDPPAGPRALARAEKGPCRGSGTYRTG